MMSLIKRFCKVEDIYNVSEQFNDLRLALTTNLINMNIVYEFYTERDMLCQILLAAGQARSKPAPPIYPFTIPPEGEQENQGYQGYQGSENNNDAMKVLRHCHLQLLPFLETLHLKFIIIYFLYNLLECPPRHEFLMEKNPEKYVKN